MKQQQQHEFKDMKLNFFVGETWLFDYFKVVGPIPQKREEKQTKRKWFAKCYLDTRIKHEDDETHYHISIYDKMDDVNCQIVSFPHMDSNFPGNPAHGVYTSQLVRYSRICTSKVDFIHRLHQRSSRVRQQGFKYALLLKSLTKFFNRQGQPTRI